MTLIDKATVPFGATIVRLLEFDEKQRQRWISIWNKANVNYFREAAIEEFALPDGKERGAEKVLSLAEQPLLLLMLALYDSQDNQLRKSRVLDRTKLYDSLLRRFVTRERGKEKGFDDTNQPEKKKALDVEMQRLGVAALGMYNRRKVHILSLELNDDLKFFGSERPVAVTSGRALSQADLLLGSFLPLPSSFCITHSVSFLPLTSFLGERSRKCRLSKRFKKTKHFARNLKSVSIPLMGSHGNGLRVWFTPLCSLGPWCWK